MSREYVAYLNRPTRDGRIIADIALAEPPRPVIHAGSIIGTCSTITVEGDVVYADIDWNDDVDASGRPDWLPAAVWRLTPAVHSRVVFGDEPPAVAFTDATIVELSVTPTSDWPWDDPIQRTTPVTADELFRRLADVEPMWSDDYDTQCLWCGGWMHFPVWPVKAFVEHDPSCAWLAARDYLGTRPPHHHMRGDTQ